MNSRKPSPLDTLHTVNATRRRNSELNTIAANRGAVGDKRIERKNGWRKASGSELAKWRQGKRARKKEGVKLYVVHSAGKGDPAAFPLLHFRGWKPQDNGAPLKGWHDREPRDIPIVPNTDGKKETSRSIDGCGAPAKITRPAGNTNRSITFH